MSSDRAGQATCVSTEPEISQILHERGRRLGLPLSGTFELTSACNFNCKMCYIHQKGQGAGAELSGAQWLELARQAKKCSTVFLLLTGGEPLMHPDFKEIYTELKKMGFVLSINTNASLIEGDMAELFIKDPPYKLNISLYGASESTYKRLCQNAAFERVLKNIRRLKENGVEIKLNFSITKDNCEDIEGVYNISRQLGLNVKATTYMYPRLRTGSGTLGENDGRLDAKSAAMYRVRWDRLRYGEREFILRAKGLRAAINKPAPRTAEREGLRCRAGSTSFWINSRGEMSACGVMTARSYPVLETGFARAWEQVVRDTAALRLPAECSVCKWRPVCNVCAAVCQCETGGFEKKPEYVCALSGMSAEYFINEADAAERGEQK